MIPKEDSLHIHIAVCRRHALILLLLAALGAAASVIASDLVSSTTPIPSPSSAGSVRIGDDAADCTAAKAGTLRWHGGALQACRGSAWGAVAGGAYSFADIGYVQDGPICLVANTGTGACSCPAGTRDYALRYTNWDSGESMPVYLRRAEGAKKEPAVCVPAQF